VASRFGKLGLLVTLCVAECSCILAEGGFQGCNLGACADDDCPQLLSQAFGVPEFEPLEMDSIPETDPEFTALPPAAAVRVSCAVFVCLPTFACDSDVLGGTSLVRIDNAEECAARQRTFHSLWGEPTSLAFTLGDLRGHALPDRT
jgi:hypothetical protein